jgi:predicted alpha/beta superfamily hydrolase
VLYLLDGDVHFHWVTAIIQALATGMGGTYAIPEMIVVGLPVANRRRDLTPTRIDRDPYGRPLPSGWEVTGGNPDFLRFIRNELIPHVDSAFRTAPFRVLLGHSLGGLAVLNALYTTPATFNAYVAIDPTLWMDDRLMVRKARDVFGAPAPPARTLFVAQANNITPYDSGTVLNYTYILALNSIIRDGNTSGIRYGYRYYDGEDHGSVPLIAGYDALRFIFDGYAAHHPRAMAQPGYLTQHFERVSEVLGYRALAPAAHAEFVGQMASLAPPPSPGTPPDPLARLLGTWVRDSSSGMPPSGETLVLTPVGDGLRIVVRAGGPTGATLTDYGCRRAPDSSAAVASGEGGRCVVTVAGDSVHYTVSGSRNGAIVAVERGVLAPSPSGQSLREVVTRFIAGGRAERRRQDYARLY